MKKSVTNNYLRLFWLTLLALNSGFAFADKVTMSHEDSLPIYAVSSNNAQYTEVFGGIGSVGFSVKIDAGTFGRIKSVGILTSARAKDTQGTFLYQLHEEVDDPAVGLKPKKINHSWAYTPTAQELVKSCNELADKMRQNGHTNQSIFAQDRTVKIALYSSVTVNFTANPFDGPPTVLQPVVTLTCRKFAGLNPDIPPINPVLKQTPGVTSAQLELQEIYTLGGTCKVGLSGEIQTNVPNYKVRYRFVHHDGKQSDIKELTTGANKKASFSFQYDVPNSPGPEGGSIKLVGVGQDFESNQVAYSMDCKEPGPGSLKANPKPKVTVDDFAIGFAVSQASIKFNKQHFVGKCPMTVYATGSITTTAKGDVIYRVLHNGKAGPQKKLTLSKGGNQVFTYPLVLQKLGAKSFPSTSGAVGGSQSQTVGGVKSETIGGTAQSTNSGSTGIGGLTANQGTKSAGNVRIQILSPTVGVKLSEPAIYTLSCKTPFTPSKNNFGTKKPGAIPGKTLSQPGKNPVNTQPKKKSSTQKKLINKKWYKLRVMIPATTTRYTHLRIVGERVELKDAKKNIVKAPDGRYTLKNGHHLTLKRGRIQ